MFERQWDEAVEHPGHDVLSMTRGCGLEASAGPAIGLHESGPLNRWWLVASTSRPNTRSPRGEEGQPTEHASGPVLVLDGFIVVLNLVGLVVDDRQDLDEAEGDSQPP